MRVGNGNGGYVLLGSIWRYGGADLVEQMGDWLTWVNAGDGGDGFRTIGEANATVLDRRKTGTTR